MIAPNYETIFDVETQVELGIQRALQVADWRIENNKIQIAIQRDAGPLDGDGNETNLVTPRIEVQLVLGAIQGHYGKDSFGRIWQDVWQASLHCSVWTNRTNNNSFHGELRARIRKFLRYAESALGPDVIPYHTLSKIAESGTTPTIMADTNIDQSEITFSCFVSVRSDAWPLTQN